LTVSVKSVPCLWCCGAASSQVVQHRAGARAVADLQHVRSTRVVGRVLRLLPPAEGVQGLSAAHLLPQLDCGAARPCVNTRPLFPMEHVPGGLPGGAHRGETGPVDGLNDGITATEHLDEILPVARHPASLVFQHRFGACRQGENARVGRSRARYKSKGAFLSVHRRRPYRSPPPLKSVSPLRPSAMGLVVKTERVRSPGSAQASAAGCAPVSQRGPVMRVDVQLLTGLWHACGRPCRSRAWRAASCELLAGLFSRENPVCFRAKTVKTSLKRGVWRGQFSDTVIYRVFYIFFCKRYNMANTKCKMQNAHNQQHQIFSSFTRASESDTLT